MSEELLQRTFDEDVPPIISPNEPHMACLFLLDTSYSMNGTAINELNAAINRFKTEVCEDKTTREVLDIAIIEFNSALHIVQEFVPVEYMEPVQLVATGSTNMAPAIHTAMDMVNERSRFYYRTGTQPYKPWIIMITDGAPTCSDAEMQEAAQSVHRMEENGKLKFFSLGVEGYDSKTLHMLSDKVMRLNGKSFYNFFDWVNKSMRSISVSTPGGHIQGVPLPLDVDKDTDAWVN